jgi:neopullulanase
MTMPGAPCIYYGDEIGMTGATDPYCRAAFPWDDEASWDRSLLDFYQRAIALRHAHPVLRTGAVHTLYADHGVYACLRQQDAESAVVVYNTRETPVQMEIQLVPRTGRRKQRDSEPVAPLVADGATYRGVWNGAGLTVQQGKLGVIDVPARDAVVLIQSQTFA